MLCRIFVEFSKINRIFHGVSNPVKYVCWFVYDMEEWLDSSKVIASAIHCNVIHAHDKRSHSRRVIDQNHLIIYHMIVPK